MLFEQTISWYVSLILMSAIVIILFTWRFEAFSKIHKHLYNLHSVIIMGPKAAGKTSLMKEMADVAHHKGDFSVGHAGKVQLIDPHNFNIKSNAHLMKMNKFNNKSMIYMFDISPYSEPMKKQVKDYEKIKKMFNNVDHVVVANKVDIKDSKKLQHMKNNFDKFHQISLTKGTGLDKLKSDIASLQKLA